MKTKINRRVMFLGLGLILLSLSACSHPAINILYRLPEPTHGLVGMKVGIDFVDSRSDIQLADAAAKQQLSYFSGKFTLQTDPFKDPDPSDLYDVKRLFTHTLGKRLEYMGATLQQSPSGRDATLKILLKTFKLKFVENRWQATIAYDAQLLQGQEIRSRQNVSGSAERIKIIGTSGADQVVAEVFGDVINQLNLAEMFRAAAIKPGQARSGGAGAGAGGGGAAVGADDEDGTVFQEAE